MRTAGDLGKAVLRDVSRSFYLSLRVLPSGFREPASLGYLLARLSDTIADAGDIAPPARESLLAGLTRAVRGLGEARERSALCDELEGLADSGGLKAGEQTLLRRSGEVLAWLDEQMHQEHELIAEVIQIIVSGQSWDLTRFEGEGVVRLRSADELNEYTYRVAGCVGEFWTRLGFLKERGFADENPAVMAKLGRSYGEGLQLVNILRDVAEDWGKGRCYIPGLPGSDRDSLIKDCGDWRKTAEQKLRDGLAYCEHLLGRRLAFASGLPALLGLLTLRKLEGVSWDDLQGTVKVTRKEVRKAAWLAIRASLSAEPGRWGRAWSQLAMTSEIPKA